jgi:hypothetical protein
MKPGGMSNRDANATSSMLAMSGRLFRLLSLERISRGVALSGRILPAGISPMTVAICNRLRVKLDLL